MTRNLAIDIHAMLDTALSREQVVSRFVAAGWRARRAGFEEYELLADVGELIVESHSPILLHGSLADEVNVEPIVALLRLAGVSVAGELYGPDGALLRVFEATADA